ncbi:hypothetical protein LUZ60_008752 [Juncus effusus]|nr:hypothetical protein LUZ60_008752 [Juncus effusus]
MRFKLYRKEMIPPPAPTMLSRRLYASFSPPIPSPREAHVWYIKPDEIKDSSQLKNYLEILSPSEKQRILSLDEEKNQKNAILSKALVRTTLSRYSNWEIHPKSIKFKKGINGKPEIIWQDKNDISNLPLQFNLSHTSSLIACAISLQNPIGIDVEENRRKTMHNVISLAKRYFSPSEFEFLKSISDPDTQQREFIKLWTLKEAYVKATGRGFSSSPFKNFTIQSLKNGMKLSIEADSDCEGLTVNWQFGQFEINNSHFLSICMERDSNFSGDEENPINTKIWRTIPFIEDELVSGTDAIKYISGLK